MNWSANTRSIRKYVIYSKVYLFIWYAVLLINFTIVKFNHWHLLSRLEPKTSFFFSHEQARIDMLHDAVSRGQLRDVQILLNIVSPSLSLLKPKADNLVLSADSAGAGLLHKAVFYNHPDIIEWLVQHYPATIQVRDKVNCSITVLLAELDCIKYNGFQSWDEYRFTTSTRLRSRINIGIYSYRLARQQTSKMSMTKHLVFISSNRLKYICPVKRKIAIWKTTTVGKSSIISCTYLLAITFSITK